MTLNRKLEIIGGIGGIAVGLATGGVVPAVVGAIGAAVSGLAMLFHEKPQRSRVPKTVKPGKQAVDDEDPK